MAYTDYLNLFLAPYQATTALEVVVLFLLCMVLEFLLNQLLVKIVLGLRPNSFLCVRFRTKKNEIKHEILILEEKIKALESL